MKESDWISCKTPPTTRGVFKRKVPFMDGTVIGWQRWCGTHWGLWQKKMEHAIMDKTETEFSSAQTGYWKGLIE
jgi:hypothetical protein